MSNVSGKYSVQQIGTDENGNPVYGSFNQQTGNITPLGATNLSSGIVGGYDISSYATDPQHEQKVSNILSNIGQFNTVQEIDEYIDTNYSNSPITGQMVANASQKYGVSWEMIVAMMAQDSSMGTKGKGARTFNPGNIGNDDSGNLRNYGNWQTGVNAVAQWLSNHKANTTQQSNNQTQEKLTDVQSTSRIYYNRMLNSHNIMSSNIEQLKKQGLFKQYWGRLSPNFLKSELWQSQLQAERDFVNAVLRRESGAAIAESEFESAKKQYFPQPGDSEETIKQKSINIVTGKQIGRAHV